MALLVFRDWVLIDEPFVCIAEIVDRDGKSSLLSLVRAFDSVLAVYEGFCNLKQVLSSPSVSLLYQPQDSFAEETEDCKRIFF